MATRIVTRSRKDEDGDITALCNPGEYWSPRLKNDVISDIESELYEYYTQAPGTDPAKVHVVEDGGRKYLRTSPDLSKHNNLDDLPDC
jgi:hypothetical protein